MAVLHYQTPALGRKQKKPVSKCKYKSGIQMGILSAPEKNPD